MASVTQDNYSQWPVRQAISSSGCIAWGNTVHVFTWLTTCRGAFCWARLPETRAWICDYNHRLPETRAWICDYHHRLPETRAWICDYNQSFSMGIILALISSVEFRVWMNNYTPPFYEDFITYGCPWLCAGLGHFCYYTGREWKTETFYCGNVGQGCQIVYL